MALVAFWEVMANRSERGFRPFVLTADAFAGFDLDSRGWSVRRLPIAADPIEPNILAYHLCATGSLPVARGAVADGPVLVRLVHGYNMRDCMRIKGYAVDLVADTRQAARIPADAEPDADSDPWAVATIGSAVPPRTPVQVWRLRSAAGDVSIGCTSMLTAGEMKPTDMDVRRMPFPRVGVPDSPGWFPQGVTLSGLRHPVRGLGQFLRSRWNSSRGDLATFLRLRQPAWASEEMLTLVSLWKGPSLGRDGEQRAVLCVLQAHAHVLGELQRWSRRGTQKGP
jgi:hypothetical protein